ncbi:hypothetical protein [Garciella nitratireducens]|uniref:Uncharacterized protein n=1 Tax=Garciella nitratireducens DSM 15102 TaxID=1121911 RepID=A0A1T4K6Y1_9FIRM|nr:hypothetical protein [Garciella nitratireducens]SJZ38171.1 hypothetical protein SAMN02745973_00383 [Garciella nitratireducens DSM 15102]
MGEKIDATKEFLTENVLSVIIEYGKEMAKTQAKDVITDSSLELAATAGIDMAGSMIPGVGNAISSYRLQKRINNLSVVLAELEKRMKEIKSNFENQTEENKNTLDAILEMVIEKAANTNQNEKIKYMIHGFTTLTAIQNVSYDVTYLYYDILDRMTILDIAVLKLSYSSWNPIDSDRKTFTDIMSEFGIDYEQYNSIRNNLERMGLLENQYDNVLEKDLESLVTNVNNLNKVIISMQEALKNPKKKMTSLRKNSTVKLKAKDRLRISTFDREFIRFFIADNHEL